MKPTREQYLKWAKEADQGFTGREEDSLGTCIVGVEAVEALCQRVWNEAMEAEREACARVCDEESDFAYRQRSGQNGNLVNTMLGHHAAQASRCADAIRARGGKE